MEFEETVIEGRNPVLEAFRAGKTVDKLYVLDGCMDGPVRTIIREAKKQDTIINFVSKERLDQMSETGRHQGVIAHTAAFTYAQVEDILEIAREKGEDPFVFLLDNIEDPHNLGDHTDSQPGGSPWRHHPETPGGRSDGRGSQSVSRSGGLYAGGEGCQSQQDYGGIKDAGDVVCLRGHGRDADV